MKKKTFIPIMTFKKVTTNGQSVIGILDNLYSCNTYQLAKSGNLTGIVIDDSELKIYSPWVATFLHLGNIPEPDKVIKSLTVYINSYREGYKKGYLEGQKFFMDEIKNNPFQSKDTVVKDVLELEAKLKREIAKKETVLNFNVFHEYGKHSGIFEELNKFKNLNRTLFKNQAEGNSEKKIFLRNLFKVKSKYEKTINLLEKNEFIEKENDKMTFIGHKKNLSLSQKKMISGLGYTLNNKLHLLSDDLSDSDISSALTSLFGVKISKQIYGAAIKDFIYQSDKANEYLDSYFFIK